MSFDFSLQPRALLSWSTDAAAFGYSFEKAEQVGYKKELDAAIKGLKEMHKRGITVLPGGDYGFAWTPHGTYARDLEHFVKLLDFTPMESVVAVSIISNDGMRILTLRIDCFSGNSWCSQALHARRRARENQGRLLRRLYSRERRSSQGHLGVAGAR